MKADDEIKVILVDIRNMLKTIVAIFILGDAVICAGVIHQTVAGAQAAGDNIQAVNVEMVGGQRVDSQYVKPLRVVVVKK